MQRRPSFRLQVKVGPTSYFVEIERRLLEKLPGRLTDLGRGKQLLLVTNPVVWKLYGRGLLRNLIQRDFQAVKILLPDGEQYKTLSSVQTLYREFASAKANRETLVLALGGGVVGDLAGFAASTFMRGLPLIHIPTTLVAQIDSSIGGKTGVNLPQAKNLAGSFHQPLAVFADPETLFTLPPRELLNGMGELIKTAILSPSGLFRYLEESSEEILKGNPDLLEPAVRMAAKVKASIVSKDPWEKNLRMILNLGHTFGHAIETAGRYKRITHGEGVGIGIAAAARLSCSLGFCPSGTVERIENCLRRYGLPASLPSLNSLAFEKALSLDKKRKRGSLNVVLVRRVGSVFVHSIAPSIPLQKFLSEES